MVHAALSGDLKSVEYDENEQFHVSIPRACPDVPTELLDPRKSWKDPVAYDARAAKLTTEFAAHFDKAYGNKGIAPEVAAQCPGK